MPRRKTHEEFVGIVKKLSPDIEVIGTYRTSADRIKVKCLSCGKIWSPYASSVLAGQGCRQCRIKVFSNSRKKTNDEFLLELSKVNSNVEILTPYINSHTKLSARCKVCGNIWGITPKDLLHGYGCRQCFLNRNSQLRRMKADEYLRRVSVKNPNIEIIGQYDQLNAPLDVKCKNCGYSWSPKASSVLRGAGCPICTKERVANSHRKTQNDFENELRAINPNIAIKGKYITIDTPISCECLVCGYNWDTTPYSLLNGRGCRRCSRSGTSFMEQFILLSFQKALGENTVLSRDRKAIDMELDIYIPSYNVAIEPGTWAFHKNSLERDKLKRNVSNSKGIRLFTIYDSFPKNRKPPFSENCFVFSDDYNTADHINIRNLVIQLFAEVNVLCTFSEDEWNNIEQRAYINARAKNTEDFIAELDLIRSDVEVIGVYVGSKIPIDVRCKKCNHIWVARPANLLHNSGCPECAKKESSKRQRKSHEQFVKEVALIQPQITIIGKYSKGHDHVKALCNVCGTRWNPIAATLLSGEGCPSCGKIKKADGRRKTHEQYEKELKSQNPDLILIGKYEGSHIPIKVKCTKCGYEWSRQAIKLLENPHHRSEKRMHDDSSN